MTSPSSLQTAWEKYLKDNDSKSFQSVAEKHMGGIPGDAEYPYLHRIQDIVIANSGYRIVRLYDQEDGNEIIYVDRVVNPDPELGVPYWLSGNQLKRWIEDELENPSQGPVDWGIYR